MMSSGPEVGARVRVYWPIEQQWFEGVVDRMSEQHGQRYFRVQYDDNDMQWHSADEKWDCLRQSRKRLCPASISSQTTNGKRTQSLPTPTRGQRVRVYWEEECKWFEGTVRDFEEFTRYHLIVYDDGDQRHENLEDPRLRWSVVDCDLPSAINSTAQANGQSTEVDRRPAVMMRESSETPAESQTSPSLASQLAPAVAEAEDLVAESNVVHEEKALPQRGSPSNAYSLRHSTSKRTLPAFAKGDLVYVPFDDGNRHLATVTDCIERDRTSMGCPGFMYSVVCHDGETAQDVHEDEMKAAPRSGPAEAEPPVEVRRPTPEQRDKFRAVGSLPATNIPPECMVHGAAHCGGDLCFPNLTLAHPSLGTRMPVFMMAPSAVASFRGASLCHCTLEHHVQRSGGCAAHVSFAVQTPALTLGLPAQVSKRLELEAELQAKAVLDSRTPYWKDAVWLPVWHFRKAPSPTTRLAYDEQLMYALPWRRIILYDAEKAERIPLVFYSMDGGLDDELAAFARSHFSFLHDQWEFKLDRHQNEANRSGCLHVDAKGDQRMEMLGIHSRQRNVSNPPEKCRAKRGRQHLIANPQGDLDAYVVHFDYPNLFCSAQLTQLWNGISGRMRTLLPLVSQHMIRMLKEAHVQERLYSVAAVDGISDDLLVNNVGVSAAYQSPPHFDVTDVGWTYAFSCKCGLCHCQSVDHM